MRPVTRFAAVVFYACCAAAWLLLAIADFRFLSAQDRVRVAVPAARAPIMAADNVRFAVPVAANQPIVAQIRGQIEPMLKVELSFVNRAANLNDDQRRVLVAASLKWFDEFVAEFAKSQDPNERLMWLQGMRGVMIGNAGLGPGPRESVQRGVAGVAASTLPKEKVALYESECTRRMQFYREVAVANLVVCADEQLRLSRNQRLDITDSLLENWEKGAVPQLEVFMLGTNGLPPSTEMWIRPELSVAQRRLLNGMEKIQPQIFLGQADFGAPGEVIDDVELPAQPEADNPAPIIDAANVDIFQP
jgi:hypothetical protein